jgi:hypothetical protein
MGLTHRELAPNATAGVIEALTEGFLNNLEWVPETLDGADKGQKHRLTKRSPVPTYLFVTLSFCPSNESRWNVEDEAGEDKNSG